LDVIAFFFKRTLAWRKSLEISRIEIPEKRKGGQMLSILRIPACDVIKACKG
jgi:hypothetical protein